MPEPITYPGRNRETDQKLVLCSLLDKFVETLEYEACEYGAWTNNGKRPFGDSSHEQIHRDICEAIGLKIDEQRCPHCHEAIRADGAPDWEAYAASLYFDIGPALARHWKRMRANEGGA